MTLEDVQEYLIPRVRDVPLSTWDPVGVGDNPSLRDEYDAYLGDIVRMLNDPSTTTEAIGQYLAHVEKDKMGLSGDPVRRLETAEALMELAGGR